jgi:2,3,4,5-tetrahydropyridine-2-carboxylate N-succinyltransferase
MTTTTDLAPLIETAWDRRDSLTPDEIWKLREPVDRVMLLLDSGQLRVATPVTGATANSTTWTVNEWVKKAILLSFRLTASAPMAGGYDKVPLKFAHWSAEDFAGAKFRAVPGAIVRRGAYIAPGAILMPSFTNIGAHIGANTMIDSYVTVGSCAQIGADCHISSGVVIGGVLEPLQANPVIIEDNCFIGANSSVTEGVIVRQGAVIAMGVHLSASTKIIDRTKDNALARGRVPPGAVVVPGTLAVPHSGGVSTACAIIVKRVDAATRAKTSVNDLLRD